MLIEEPETVAVAVIWMVLLTFPEAGEVMVTTGFCGDWLLSTSMVIWLVVARLRAL